MTALAASIVLHAALGLALAVLVWTVGTGALVLLRRPLDARSLLDAYPVGLLVLLAAAVLPLVSRPLGVLSVAALAALAAPALRARSLPRPDGSLAVALTAAAAFGSGLGALLHGPTDDLDSGAYGGMLWYVAKVVSATESIVPFRDPLAEGEQMIYAEAGTSFVGAVFTSLPGFDAILYHAASLPAYAAASLAIGLWLFRRGGAAITARAAGAGALLAAAVAAYPTWVTETPPAAFALPLVFSLWRIWRDELDARWLIALSAIVALDYFQTKVIAIMALGVLLLGGLVERNRGRPDFRRLVVIGGALLAAGAAIVIGLLFAFASWYAGLSEPKALPLDAVRGIVDGDLDARSVGLASLIAGEVVLAAALARRRSWTLLAALAAAVVPSWFLAGYGFDIALFSAIFLAGLLVLAGELDERLALAAGVLLVVAAALREVMGPQPGVVLTLALLLAFGAALVPARDAVRAATATVAAVLLALAGLPVAALATVAIVAAAMTLVPRRRAVALGVAAAVGIGAAAWRGVDIGDPAPAVTPADRDVWNAVADRVPDDALVFTSLTGLDVTPHAGWNNYPAVSGRQIFVAGWYDGRLVSNDADRDRKLAENAAVLEGRTRPDELELSRSYSAAYAVVRADDDVPAGFRRVYSNSEYVLYRIS